LEKAGRDYKEKDDRKQHMQEEYKKIVEELKADKAQK
jgi:hypothetical protein